MENFLENSELSLIEIISLAYDIPKNQIVIKWKNERNGGYYDPEGCDIRNCEIFINFTLKIISNIKIIKSEKTFEYLLKSINSKTISCNYHYVSKTNCEHVRIKYREVQNFFKCNNINDNCFNPINQEDSNIVKDLKIPWIGDKADFACIIKLLHQYKYISAESFKEAIKITFPHFSGIESTIDSLESLFHKRKKENQDWNKLLEDNGFPKAK